MNLIDKRVKVISGYYKDFEGIVEGETVDGYWMVTPQDGTSFFARSNELIIISQTDDDI